MKIKKRLSSTNLIKEKLQACVNSLNKQKKMLDFTKMKK